MPFKVECAMDSSKHFTYWHTLLRVYRTVTTSVMLLALAVLMLTGAWVRWTSLMLVVPLLTRILLNSGYCLTDTVG